MSRRSVSPPTVAARQRTRRLAGAVLALGLLAGQAAIDAQADSPVPAEPGAGTSPAAASAPRDATPATATTLPPDAATPATPVPPPVSAAATAPSGPLRVVLPSRAPTVGDRAEIVLELTVPADCKLGGSPRFPTWNAPEGGGPATWGEVEVLASAVTGSAPNLRQTVTVAAFRPGILTLPPVEVALPCADATRNLRTPSALAFTVQSLLPAEGEPPPPRPAAPPRQLPHPAAFWWALAALTATVLALAWLLVRQRRRRPAALTVSAATIPALAPLAELEARLAQLADELAALAADREVPAPARERFHVGLSAALRRYLERELATPATKSSTTEIQRALFSRQLPPALVRPLIRLLRDCDGVKFARALASPAEARGRLGQADELAHAVHAALHLDPAVVPAPVPAPPGPPMPPMPPANRSAA